MEKKNLKELFHRLRSLVDELESEIYSDPGSYLDFDKEKHVVKDEDDGYPD